MGGERVKPPKGGPMPPFGTSRSVGDQIAIAGREGDHVYIGEHVVADLDRGDLAIRVAVEEDDTAGLPEVLAVFLAGFDAEFHVLSGHWIFLSCWRFDDPDKRGGKRGCQRLIWLRKEGPAGAGEMSL